MIASGFLLRERLAHHNLNFDPVFQELAQESRYSHEHNREAKFSRYFASNLILAQR